MCAFTNLMHGHKVTVHVNGVLSIAHLHSEQQTLNVLVLKPGDSTKICCCCTRLGIYLFAGCWLVTRVWVQARLLSCARPRARLAWSPAASAFVSAADTPQRPAAWLPPSSPTPLHGSIAWNPDSGGGRGTATIGVRKDPRGGTR